MNHQIWVIDNIAEEQVFEPRIGRSSAPAWEQKGDKTVNPVLAYSLSLIVWGWGQFCNRQWKLGAMFLLLMIQFYVFMSVVIIYRGSVQSFFESVGIDSSTLLLIIASFYILGLMAWHVSAWQAYFKSRKMNPGSHRGIQAPWFPPLCSFLIPGWGQVLNGQIKKGLLFHLFAFFIHTALFFNLILVFLWPVLEASPSRLVIEWIISVSLVLSPLIFILWILNIFDAAKVSINHIKKESLRTRMKYALNRFRNHIQMYGLKNTLLPVIKRKILVLLMILLCIIAYHSVPEEFYRQQLHSLITYLSEKDMTVIPGIIHNLLSS